MAFAFVDSDQDEVSASSIAAAYSATPPDGNLLIIVFRAASPRVVADVTLPAGYVSRVAENDAGGGCLVIADKIAASDGTTQTVTISGGAVSCSLIILQFSGVAASGYFDQASYADLGSVDTAQPGSITPNNATELMVAAATQQDGSNGGSEAIDSSFTIRETSGARLVCGTKIKTTGTAENPSLSWGTARNSAAGMVAYSTTTISAGTGLPDRHLPRGITRGVTRGVT